MAISKLLQTVYASAPTDVVIIPTLEIQAPGETIRLVHAYEDQQLKVDGVMQTFESCSIQIALPAKDTSGNQTLTFGLGLVDGRAQRIIMDAIDTGQPSYLVYREYLSTDTSAPARTPIRMVISGGQFSGAMVQIEASYFDMLNTAWPRERYTVESAPGVKYLG